MDEIAQFYQYPYYQTPPPPPPPVPPPPPPGTTLHSLPPVVVQPLPIPQYHHPHHPSAPPLYPQDSHDDVRTLFIAGLPEDVKPREIYNLFREFAGYESSHLRSQTSSNSQPFAFAVFADQHSALMAMYELNGMVFDFEKDSKLYIELAKSNSRSKRLRPDDGRPVSEKRIKGSAAISRDGVTVVLAADPCPTLFIANLGQSCTEQELIQLFSRFRGFLKLKMQSTYGAPVAFVDFQDTASSTEALSHLQGTILHSSSGEGMRLEYAKSRMGLRSKKSR
ncbi:hypothetical protein AABB24_025061 [Solanum stoloniferum]|uniref:RRM domain-containing protein n=1 Tax=Solanum stoloniferum TaxID=62892 RepID=A0ABD2SRL5_9SOLN